MYWAVYYFRVELHDRILSRNETPKVFALLLLVVISYL